MLSLFLAFSPLCYHWCVSVRLCSLFPPISPLSTFIGVYQLGDVLLALSCDLRRSVYERLRMHCDSLAVTGASFRFHGDAGGDHRDELASPPADSVLHELPRRVLAPLAPSSGSRGKHVAGGVECLCVSDYLFPGDTTSDSLVTLVELFNIDISADLLDDNVEVFSGEHVSLLSPLSLS